MDDNNAADAAALGLSAPSQDGLKDVCADSECVEKGKICCTKILACGCACNGVRDEKECLPCLKHTLKCDEDFCAICYVESLSEAPCIQMTGQCNHVFHLKCIQSKLSAKWPGTITQTLYIQTLYTQTLNTRL